MNYVEGCKKGTEYRIMRGDAIMAQPLDLYYNVINLIEEFKLSLDKIRDLENALQRKEMNANSR